MSGHEEEAECRVKPVWQHSAVLLMPSSQRRHDERRRPVQLKDGSHPPAHARFRSLSIYMLANALVPPPLAPRLLPIQLVNHFNHILLLL